MLARVGWLSFAARLTKFFYSHLLTCQSDKSITARGEKLQKLLANLQLPNHRRALPSCVRFCNCADFGYRVQLPFSLTLADLYNLLQRIPLCDACGFSLSGLELHFGIQRAQTSRRARNSGALQLDKDADVYVIQDAAKLTVLDVFKMLSENIDDLILYVYHRVGSRLLAID